MNRFKKAMFKVFIAIVAVGSAGITVAGFYLAPNSRKDTLYMPGIPVVAAIVLILPFLIALLLAHGAQ